MPPSVVLTMHPNTKEIWQTIVPDPDPTKHTHIETGLSGWHRSSMDPVMWDSVHASLVQGVNFVEQHPGATVHVLAAGPYSLGLLLGRKLEAHRPLVVYQFDNTQPGGKKWVSWGPKDEAETPRTTPFFQELEGASPFPREDVRDVTLTVEISVSIFENVVQARAGLGLSAATDLRLRVPVPSQQAMRAGDAGVAEQELWAALERIRLRYPKARVHLFYGGPLALLIRVGRRVHVGGQSLIFYERLDTGEYYPTMRFPDCEPLWRPEAQGRPAVLRHLPHQAGRGYAGGERFELEVDGETRPLSLRAPSGDTFEADLSWLLNRRLNEDPGLAESAAYCARIEAALIQWAEDTGRALTDALGGLPLASLQLDLLSPTNPVGRWPWEWVTLPDGQALGATVPLWRRVFDPPPRTLGPAQDGPIRVLLCVSRHAYPGASGDVGYRNVASALMQTAALHPDRLVVELLPRPCTLRAIQARLGRAEPPIHVLHIDGHGLEGSLCLEDDQLREQNVTAPELAAAVTGRGLRAVVLNACHSAAPRRGEPLADMAVALHRGGVPAVLAMQAALRVDAARAWAAALYAKLAETGRLDLATMAARDALYRDKHRDSRGRSFTHSDWGVPTLYLHPSGARVARLDRAPTPVATTAPAPGLIAMDWMVLQLDQLVAHAYVGAVLIHGPLGAGKSTLIQDALRWWRDAGWLVGEPVTVTWTGPAPGFSPGATAAQRLREARERVTAQLDGPLKIVVWDDFDATSSWRWSPEERRTFVEASRALTAQGARLLLVGRDRARWLTEVTRLPMEGLAEREARALGRAGASSRPGAQRGDGDHIFTVVDKVSTKSAHNPATLRAMFFAAFNEGWTPPAALDADQLPDALQEPFNALAESLAPARGSLDATTLIGLTQRISRCGRELRVSREEARLDGPMDLLERAGAVGLAPQRNDAGTLRYLVHPLFASWVAWTTRG